MMRRISNWLSGAVYRSPRSTEKCARSPMHSVFHCGRCLVTGGLCPEWHSNPMCPRLNRTISRRFSLRARNLMWLLGAGACAAAGIPTARDMI